MTEPPETEPPAEELTDLLRRMRERGERSDPHLDPVVYDEVRRLAHGLMRKERDGHTLQPTALANEAYARLIDGKRAMPTDKAHFLALVARAMRRILVDHARARQAAKRGGDWQRVMLADVHEASEGEGGDLDLVALDGALSELADFDETKALIVELRFFAGMSVPDVALVLGCGETFVRTEWYVARAWLKTRLAG
ncbi:MAG: ECF-type sigma factor [Planctomycetota bacterium]|nr:ECF-type sigma factor [Planctomycetota bacterium]